MMLRVLLTVLIIIHGLIHLLVFVKEFGLGNVQQISGRTLFPISGNHAKLIGALWLLTCLLFVITAILFIVRKDWWWMTCALSILLSQTLIILYWHDAKFGTIANLIILFTIILAYSSWDFQRTSNKDIAALFPKSLDSRKVITKEMIDSLPPAVQRWLNRSGIIGKELIQHVYLKQKGEMRTTPEGNWMKVEAEQYFNVLEPGFIWIADVSANKYIHLKGRDRYQDGKGHMLIKALSLIPVADSKGKMIDQGTLLRYLGESVWFPSFAISKYIHWEEIDLTSARVTMDYKGVSASGIFRFNSNGDLKSFEAKRYYDRKEGPTLEDWLVVIDPNGYKEFDGIRVPAKSSVTWRLQSGNFTWFKLEILDIKYNKLNSKNF